ncbi:MAG TPA: dTDP-4-dehydrorhamnose 3,5-epimerase, partial [Polyangiaceae bacterium]|nr:dTDP-4-dehydrorhamnose 3,5-epimerase [Polyangiaceae bacterium]
PTKLADAVVVELEQHRDERGFFARSFCEREFEAHGLPRHFPQCNLSRNDRAGTLRGMHFNAPPFEEAKLVRCVRGSIYDVIIDLRPRSPTYAEWVAVELSADAGLALYVPPGFAHGFLTLVDVTDVFYHMGAFFQADAARGLRYDDAAFAVRWPREVVVISERDATYPDFDVEAWRVGP